MAVQHEDPVTEGLYFEETPFEQLMQIRIVEVLMVCSSYDRFNLEKDGRIEEQLFHEYVGLGLRHPPQFCFAATVDEALELLGRRSFDLVITMVEVDGSHISGFIADLRRCHGDKPVVVLTRSSSDSLLDPTGKALPIRHVFHWQGEPNILLAIVKLLEDGMNADHDAKVVGVQVIILVEDSVRFYSSYLPIIYRTLFEQARALMREGLNEYQQSLRMRGRPKILLATTYEQAFELYERYQGNLLGVISDVSYPRGGQVDPQAGLALCRHMRLRDPDLPILLQSSRQEHAAAADGLRAAFLRKEKSFIHKRSRTLLNELESYIRANFGFGDFVFVRPDTGEPIDRAENLVEFHHKLATVAAESLEYHARSHHFSTWLKARACYALANFLRQNSVDDFADIEAVRRYLVDAVRHYRLHLGRGVVGDFDRRTFDDSSVFHRIGSGTLGGKARGIALINAFLKERRLMYKYDGVAIQIPKTIVLTTDIFERFMESNDLNDFAFEDHSDEVILERFLGAELPEEVGADLAALVSVIRRPLAIRSSSTLEDSSVQPFAGVYATYFTANANPELAARVHELSLAVKAVYASTYFLHAKRYAAATDSLIEEEKMAVIIQEVTGTEYDGLFYPNFSGVARSLNFYPVEQERPEEGIANLALGLGKTVVDGHTSLRFSPAHPKKVFQLSDPMMALRSTQRKFYAIDLAVDGSQVGLDEGHNLRHLDVSAAASHRANARLMSTYDRDRQTLSDDPDRVGIKRVTFASILQYDTLPLASIVTDLLTVGSREMNMPVEIEFACNLDVAADARVQFKVLQIRPIVDSQEFEALAVDDIDTDQAIIQAKLAQGHGLYSDLRDVVVVRPEAFDRSRTQEIGGTIETLNRALMAAGRRYILIGPGRWGSSDPWLGIPVRWSDISHASVIVEAALDGFSVDGSQGSHFFQNMTSQRVAYITINPPAGDGTYDVDYLDAQPAQYEDGFVRHLRFDAPLVVKIDGRRGGSHVKAVVLKPEE